MPHISWDITHMIWAISYGPLLDAEYDLMLPIMHFTYWTWPRPFEMNFKKHIICYISYVTYHMLRTICTISGNTWYVTYDMWHTLWAVWYLSYDMVHILWTIIWKAFNIMIWYTSWNSPESYIQGKDKVWQPRYYEANHNEKDGLVYTITPLIWNRHDRGQCHHNFYVTKINYLHYIM